MRPNHPYRFAQNGGEFLHKLIRHVPKVPEGKPDLAESPGRLRNIIPDVKTFSAGGAGNRRIAFAAKPFSRHIVKLFPDIFSAARTDGRLKTSFQIGKNIFSVKLFDTESVYGEAAIRLAAADMGVPFAVYPVAAAFGKDADFFPCLCRCTMPFVTVSIFAGFLGSYRN